MKNKIYYYQVYSESSDMTFIMGVKPYANNAKHTISVYSFYFGKPENSLIDKYINDNVACLDFPPDDFINALILENNGFYEE